jgi:enoyl-CoA hydratase/carnithine racemase
VARVGDTVQLAWPEDEVALLTLDRPDAGNALSTQLARDIAGAVAEVRARPVAKALVITGAGRMFCAGADLKETPKPPGWLDLLRRTFDEVADLPVPTIAAINGACMGGGTELALACDIRIIAMWARIGLPEITFGALPAAGGPQRLARLVGPSRAKWLVMSGARLSAEEAAGIGLVDRVVHDGEAMAQGLTMARELATHAGYALRTAKAAIDRGAALPLADALEAEYRLIDTMATPEERAAEMQKAMGRSATYNRIFGGPADDGRPAAGGGAPAPGSGA